ncbi:SIMPL domain-containing protein [Halobellus rubicundus]|uniref:SIMPL domain-containing protein n=1 Tax=Halobellus rubicundus TaxID=2996466 RepID=A0ABD5M6I3_9EURY
MNRRFGLVTIAVAALVLFAGCAAPLQADNGTATAATDASGDRTISTAGTGEASADADRAIVTIAVSAHAETAEAARDSVAADAAQLREALRELGIADQAVRTVSYRLSPRYESLDGRSGGEVAGYEAVHAYRIETAPAEAGRVVDTAVGNGASEVYGVSFTLSDEARAELRAQALERAMADARADADVVAGAAGLSVTGVQSVSVGSDYGPIYESRVAADAGGAGTQFDAGPVTVTARVDVTYTAA